MGRYAGPDRRKAEIHSRQDDVVCLKRKYAEVIDGIDLSGRHPGERLSIPPPEASLLIAEGWAERIPAKRRRRSDFHAARSGGEPDDDREQCA